MNEKTASRSPRIQPLPETRRGGRIPCTDRTQNRLLMIFLGVVLIYALSVAQSLLIPVALAFLLSLVLAPVLRILEHARVPRTLGAGLLVAALLGGLGWGVYSFVDPVSEWVDRAPTVLRQLERKVYPIKKTVEDVGKTADQVDRITSVDTKKTVEVQKFSARDVLYQNARQLLVGLLMTSFLLYFFLSWGRVMWIRLARLVRNREHRHRFLELSRVMEGEVSRYLLVITTINAGLGVAVAGALYLLGMPDPLLWGSVAALLNFVPYIGALFTAVMLGATALLSMDGLALPSLVVAIFIFLTALEGQVVTPTVLGQRLALNPLVVFLSIVFWFWLWGVAGALMAVPILITLKLIGNRVPAMRPFALLAGR